MPIRIAINGFGRIGRGIARALIALPETSLQLVAINDLAPIEVAAHLMRYDSVHGYTSEVHETPDGTLHLGAHQAQYLSVADPSDLPWRRMEVDLVLECTGRFTKRTHAAKHLGAGAGRVLVSAPMTDADFVTVYRVNHDGLRPEHRVVSAASCTTNCLAPLALVVDRLAGILGGYMSTIHAYTADQALVDSPHRDLRRGRAAALSSVPTSTGAARTIGQVLPSLSGKLDGTAVRVPVANVSMISFTAVTKVATNVEDINRAFDAASKGDLRGVLGINGEPLVSSDFNGRPESCIFDRTQTQTLPANVVRVLGWYDNETGFSNRMLDLSSVMGSFS